MSKLPEIDREVFLYLNHLGSDFWDPLWLAATEGIYWTPLFAFLIVRMFMLLRREQFWTALILLILCVTLTDQTSVQLFKNVFQRLRPCHEPGLEEMVRLVKDGCGGKYGFVSSHATNSFGVATLVSLILKKYRWAGGLMFFWAVIFSYSRIYLGVHYPGDVVGGSILGALLGGLVYLLYSPLSRKFSGSK